MKTIRLSLFIIAISVYSVNAQYTPIEPDSLTTENYSSTEIRKYLLNDPLTDNDIRHLAKQSRVTSILGMVCIGFGLINTITGVDMMSSNEYLGLIFGSVYMTGGIVQLGFGVLFAHQSRKRLLKAIEMYQQRY